jgi:hypothetical protein
MVVVVALAALTVSASAIATKKTDVKIAKAGVLVIGDFPSGFKASKPDTSSDAAVGKLAKTIPTCRDYAALKKLTDAQTKAKSQDFKDDSRDVSNEVDVFASAGSAHAALALAGKDGVETCLNQLFEKLLTKKSVDDPKSGISAVKVHITRQSVDAGGDESVVYEGSITLTAKDGDHQIGVGFAAIRTGRVVDAMTYQTTGAELTDLLQPLIDACLGRIDAALSK